MGRTGSAVCLICNAEISSMKRSNVKRHLNTCQATFASEYPDGDSRKKACLELLRDVEASQQQFRAWTQRDDPNSASFAALAIVKNGNHSQFAKIFRLDVANKLFEDFLSKEK